MDKRDQIKIQHMLDAIKEALHFTAERDRADFETDRMLSLAVVKSLEIMGEAAARVSADTKESSQHIPWALIIGMRNRLIHGYFDIDYEIVWNTIQTDLLPLQKDLKDLLDSFNE